MNRSMDCRKSSALRHGGLLALVALTWSAGFPLVWASAVQVSLVTKITYDAGDNPVSVTDPRGLVTIQATDGLGQRWQLVSPDTGTTNFAYDAYGRLSAMTRANGVQTTYGYDGLNRRTTLSAGGLTQTFVYDNCSHGLGRPCGSSDADGATSYSYTPEGWMSGRGFSMGGTTYALGFNYDATGKPTVITYPDGNAAIYNYTNGVVGSVGLNLGGAAATAASAITYRPMDIAMSGWTSSNGLINTLNYDTDGRLTGISVPGIQSLTFAYDAASRLQQITNGIDTTLTQTLGYDTQSQLSAVTSGAENESYQYDAGGNRLTATVNGIAETYTYSPTSNQLTGVSSALSTQYGYDANGNTTLINGASGYQYDAFNRLNASGGASNYVNPEGQRLLKFGGSTGTTYFAPNVDGTLLAENDNGTWVDYVPLNGRLVSRISGGQVSAIHSDEVSRPEVVTDATQAINWRAQNFPFMQKVILAKISMNLGFPGQYYDAETLTWNNGFRDYSSGFGRYLESDPIGLAGGNNTYTYVGSNPMEDIDPLGLVNVVAQVGGSAVQALGGTGAFGIYVTLPSPGNYIDIGVYGSAGPAGGELVGAGTGLGFIKGNVTDIRGISYNAEAAGVAGDGTVMFDEHRHIIGAVVGPAAELGFAISVTKTGAHGLNELGSWFGIWLYNKLNKDCN